MYHYEKKDRKSLGAQTEDELMKYILQEPIKPGQKIPNEFELAEKFGVGRSTVREAVKGLVSRGILEVRRGSGTYVVSTTPMDLDPLGLGAVEDKMALAMDLVNVRMILEPGIAEMAAMNATARDVERLRELCAVIEQKIETGENYIEEDIAFHTAVAKCSGNMVVEQLVPIIDTAVMMFVNVTHRKLTQETIMTHRAVTDAIAERDPMGAKSAMMMHMTFNRNMIKEMIKNNEK